MLKIFLLLFIFFNLFAQDNGDESEKWDIVRSNIYFENDMYFNTDYDYTAGIRLSFLYNVKNPGENIFDFSPLNFGDANTYRSFAIVHQMYTPKNKYATMLIPDDRPYAGWTYLETGLHKSSRKHLRSLNIKVGIIGPYSGAEDLQNFTHRVIGYPRVYGWDNQLSTEVGVNLKYSHKWRLMYKKNHIFESSFVPFGEIELGNVSTKATGGFSMRIGYNIPKDFGVSSIDIGGEDGIPAYKEEILTKNKCWSFSFNIHAATSLVARDIFLDGNTFKESHSVNKEEIIGYGGVGISIRYQRFIFDFIQTYNTRKFTSEDRGHDTGSIVISWIFN